MAQEMGAPELTADLFAALGEVQLAQGDIAAASDQAGKAISATASEDAESEEYARALRLTALVRKAECAKDEARSLLQQSVAVFQSLRNDYELAKTCFELGLLLQQAFNDSQTAHTYFEKAAALFAKLPAPRALEQTRMALVR